jgi:hypothetical protein
VSLVKSRVCPAGTATEFKTMVAQAALDLETWDAPDDPEKVQVALFAKSGAAVGAGAAAGAAETRETAVAARLRMVES